MEETKPTLVRLWARWMGWNRASGFLLSAFFLTIFLIVYIWWPLTEEYLAYVDWHGPWWLYLDWLLIGIFLFMTLLIASQADLRVDALTVLVGAAGGLVIESWGTQTLLWTYYTLERPPLWIIPAWPIASLTIDRLVRFALAAASRWKWVDCRLVYWLVFLAFFALMLAFVAPTIGQSLTVFSLVVCAALIATPTDHRMAILTFAAGSGLGYFLEVWGTTRQCWTYYTLETPPLFAVLAHGMAAVAFWRAGLIIKALANKGKSSRWSYRLPGKLSQEG